MNTAQPPGGLRGPLSSSPPVAPAPPKREPVPRPPRPAGPEHRLWLPPLVHAEASRLGEELSTSVSRAKSRKAADCF